MAAMSGVQMAEQEIEALTNMFNGCVLCSWEQPSVEEGVCLKMRSTFYNIYHVYSYVRTLQLFRLGTQRNPSCVGCFSCLPIDEASYDSLSFRGIAVKHFLFLLRATSNNRLYTLVSVLAWYYTGLGAHAAQNNRVIESAI